MDTPTPAYCRHHYSAEIIAQCAPGAGSGPPRTARCHAGRCSLAVLGPKGTTWREDGTVALTGRGRVAGVPARLDERLTHVLRAPWLRPPAGDLRRVDRSEHEVPAADRLVRDDHTARDHQLLGTPIAEREVVGVAYAIRDDLCRLALGGPWDTLALP